MLNHFDTFWQTVTNPIQKKISTFQEKFEDFPARLKEFSGGPQFAKDVRRLSGSLDFFSAKPWVFFFVKGE